MRAVFQGEGQPQGGHWRGGHAHFWDRAVSRGGFIRTTAGVTGAVLGADLWLPALARDDRSASLPKPIPQGGIGGDFRVFVFGPGNEPSTITDFNGFIGVTDVQGMATNTSTGERLLVDTDMRFMQGVYVSVDGRHHQGTFGFV